MSLWNALYTGSVESTTGSEYSDFASRKFITDSHGSTTSSELFIFAFEILTTGSLQTTTGSNLLDFPKSHY